MLDGTTLREKIEEKLLLDFLTEFQKSFLTSVIWKISKGWELSEKQKNLLDKILHELDEMERTGHIWEPSEDEKKKIGAILDLSKSYSGYYLGNYKPALQKALRSLLETKLKISTGAKVLKSEKNQLDLASEIMKSKLKPFEEPDFFAGDLVTVNTRAGKEPAVILSGPEISRQGFVFYTVDLGGNQVDTSHGNIKSMNKKRRTKNDKEKPI